MRTWQIAVIVGSLRKESFNRQLGAALCKLAPKEFACRTLEIGDLPSVISYEAELDFDGTAKTVKPLKGETACNVPA